VWIVQLALRRPYTFVVLAMLIVLVGLVEIPRMLRAANQPGADRRYQGRPPAGVKGAESEYARSLLRTAGPSVAERSRAGCKEQRSAEYWTYSSERRRRRRPGSARHATPGGYSQQAPRGRLTDSRDRASGAGDTSARLRHKTAL
jgi:hypothetical protein